MRNRVQKKVLRLVMGYITMITDEEADIAQFDELNDMITKMLIDAYFECLISEEEYEGYLKLVAWTTELAKVNMRWIYGID